MSATGQVLYTGRKRKRMVLVLDCLVPHDYNNKTADLINLQYYVIKEKKLSEKEAVVIFFDIVRIVESLHNVCLLCSVLVFPCHLYVLKYVVIIVAAKYCA